ncbi:MAG: PqqD family protein [Paracoccaceae bacterium]
MGRNVLIKFDDVVAPVMFTGCRDALALLPDILPFWPFHEIAEADAPADPLISVGETAGGAMLSSPFMERPLVYRDPVDTVCALIVELAWATLRDRPGLLCVHGAAVEFAGRLVLFPNTKRVGKSTLTACLSARGMRVFTDDFLPIEVDAGGLPLGIAGGVAARLRLPLPDDLSDAMKRITQDNIAAANTRYAYLKPGAGGLAPRGTRLPFGAIVLLERDATSEASLLPADKAEVLSAAIRQNFSRSVNPGRILQALHFLASSVEIKTLKYSRAEDAAEALCKAFSAWPREISAARLPVADFAEDGEVPVLPEVRERFDSKALYVRSADTVEYTVDDAHFLADNNRYAIHRLNEMSLAVWKLLEEPAPLADIVDMFCHAFPDTPRQRIDDDITKLLEMFVGNGLITAASTRPLETVEGQLE